MLLQSLIYWTGLRCRMYLAKGQKKTPDHRLYLPCDREQYHFPSEKLVKYSNSSSGRPYFSFASSKRPDHKGHISRQIPNSLQSFQIFFHILCCKAINDIPVRASCQHHIPVDEVFVQYIHGCRTSASSCTDHSRTNLHLFRIWGAVHLSL